MAAPSELTRSSVAPQLQSQQEPIAQPQIQQPQVHQALEAPQSLFSMIQVDSAYLLGEAQRTLHETSGVKLFSLATQSLRGLAADVRHNLGETHTQHEIAKMMIFGFLTVTAGRLASGAILRRCGLEVIERITVNDVLGMLMHNPLEIVTRLGAGGFGMAVTSTALTFLEDGLKIAQGGHSEGHFGIRSLGGGVDFTLQHIANNVLHDFTHLSLSGGPLSLIAKAALNLFVGTLILNTATVIRVDLFNHVGLSREGLGNYLEEGSFSRSMGLHLGSTGAGEALRLAAAVRSGEFQAHVSELRRNAEEKVGEAFYQLKREVNRTLEGVARSLRPAAPYVMSVLTAGVLGAVVRSSYFTREVVETHAAAISEALIVIDRSCTKEKIAGLTERRTNLTDLLEDWARCAQSDETAFRTVDQVRTRSGNLKEILDGVLKIKEQEKRDVVARIIITILLKGRTLQIEQVRKQFEALATYLRKKNALFTPAEVKIVDGLELKTLVALHMSIDTEVGISRRRLEQARLGREEIERVELNARIEAAQAAQAVVVSGGGDAPATVLEERSAVAARVVQREPTLTEGFFNQLKHRGIQEGHAVHTQLLALLELVDSQPIENRKKLRRVIQKRAFESGDRITAESISAAFKQIEADIRSGVKIPSEPPPALATTAQGSSEIGSIGAPAATPIPLPMPPVDTIIRRNIRYAGATEPAVTPVDSLRKISSPVSIEAPSWVSSFARLAYLKIANLRHRSALNEKLIPIFRVFEELERSVEVRELHSVQASHLICRLEGAQFRNTFDAQKFENHIRVAKEKRNFIIFTNEDCKDEGAWVQVLDSFYDLSEMPVEAEIRNIGFNVISTASRYLNTFRECRAEPSKAFGAILKGFNEKLRAKKLRGDFAYLKNFLENSLEELRGCLDPRRRV